MSSRELINDKDLLFHILNVGDGDNIIVEFPVDKETGQRFYGIVDCYKHEKTKAYLKKLKEIRPARDQLEFICATHPHKDHIDGIDGLLLNNRYRPKEFWDSGFRHTSNTWYQLMDHVKNLPNILFLRPTSGLSTIMAGVEITVVAPSIYLRNRYDTYGVDINNSSIVLKLTYAECTIVLAADAQ